MFTEHDLQQIKDHSLSVEQIERQLDAFKKGFPFLKLSAAATVGNGILRLGGRTYLEICAGIGCGK